MPLPNVRLKTDFFIDSDAAKALLQHSVAVITSPDLPSSLGPGVVFKVGFPEEPGIGMICPGCTVRTLGHQQIGGKTYYIVMLAMDYLDL